MTRSSGVHVREYEDDYICLHDGVELEGPVTVWEDLEAKLWGYTCHCGKPIEHDIADPSERGATPAATALFGAGIGAAFLGAAFAPVEWKQALILAGLAVSVLITFIAVTNWLDENGTNR